MRGQTVLVAFGELHKYLTSSMLTTTRQEGCTMIGLQWNLPTHLCCLRSAILPKYQKIQDQKVMHRVGSEETPLLRTMNWTCDMRLQGESDFFSSRLLIRVQEV